MRRVWRLLLPALVVLALAAGASPAGGSGPAIGTITEFTVAGLFPSGITSGPDGNLWFTSVTGPSAASRRPGQVTAFPYPGWYQWCD